MSEPIRVLHYGLGPIGLRIARLVSTRPSLVPVGAVDIDPAKAGQDLGDLAGLRRRLGVPVRPSLATALEGQRPDIVLHATGSRLAGCLTRGCTTPMRRSRS